ncbi:MAG: DUF11 domain-containing protein, partial [Caldilineaceae bacterium]|nr:DUF11 domain-containing protein [Caldilineaceae bacterium]
MKLLKLSRIPRISLHRIIPLLVLLWLVSLGANVIGAANLPTVQTFFIPLPEQQTRTALNSIDNQSRVGTVMESVISIVATSNGSVVYYDHWEDGYELDITNPTQSTTQIWGDGNTSNGNAASTSVCGTACAGDIINSGNVIALRNTVSLPRNSGTILYDGQDKVGTTQAVSVSRAEWAVAPGTVLAGAVEVLSVAKYGTAYEMPVGQNLSSNEMFQYTALFVMAGSDNTSCTYNGSPFSLNAGQNYHKAGGVNAGDLLVCDKPVQAHLITGDVNSSYESRWFTLVPDAQWSASYFAPVGTTDTSDPADVWIYNPDNSASIAVTVDTLSGSSSVAVGANSAVRVQMPSNSGAHLYTTSGASFFAIGTVDSDQSGTGNQTHDWGYSLVPERNLTPVVVVGWGPGSSDGTQNGNPIWVMASKATTVYVDYDGSSATCSHTIDGECYDTSFPLAALQSKTVYDPTGDKDQTGMRLFTADGTLLTGAWGQDPAVAGPGNPFLDMGTTVLPFPRVQLLKEFALIIDADSDGNVDPFVDTVAYTITLKNTSVVPAANVVVSDSLSANLFYVDNSTTIDGVAQTDDLTGATRFVLDEGGLTVAVLELEQVVVFAYHATVGNTGSVSNTAVATSSLFDLRVTVDTSVDQGSLTACSIDFVTGLAGSSAAFYLVNGTISLRLTDGDKNTTGGQDTVAVTVRNPSTSDREIVTLTETTGSSGIFEGSLPSSTTGGQDVEDGTLYALAGQSLSASYTDPLYGDSCTDPTPPTIATPSQTKVLYLSADGSGSPDQELDRIDPVATGDSSTALSSILSTSGTSTSFTQTLPMASNFAMPVGGLITATTYVSVTGTLAANPTITATLTSNGSTFATLNSPVATFLSGGGTSTITHDATATKTATGAISSISVNHTTGSGSNRLMLVGISIEQDDSGDADVTGITYGAQALTFVGEAAVSGEAHAQLWQLVNPLSGTASVQIAVTGAGSSDAFVVGVSTFTGVNQSTPLGSVATSNDGTSPSNIAVPSATGDLVFAVIALDDARLITPSTTGGQVTRWNEISGVSASDGIAGAASTKPGGPASVTLSWTISNDGTSIVAVPIKPVFDPAFYELTWNAALGGSTAVGSGQAVSLGVTTGITYPFQIL